MDVLRHFFIMHYIYITTNKLNGMAYIGQRKLPINKTIDNDPYLGSGTRLLYAIKKYGKENFKKKIIHVCANGVLADAIEIKEIEKRGALLDKTKFYNISSGGQLGRGVNHSEIVSKSMKNYYSIDENYTKEIIKRNRKRFIDGKSKIDNIFLCNKDISNLIKKQKKHINTYNKEHKKEIDKLIHVSRLDNSKQSNGAKAIWAKDKQHINARITKATKNRKQNCIDNKTTFHSDECISKFSLAKLKANGNQLGIYLIENGAISIALISKKLNRINNREYKNKENLYKQIKELTYIINNELSVVMDYNKVFDIIHETRTERGLGVIKKVL